MSQSRNSSDYSAVTHTADTVDHGPLTSSSNTPPSSFLQNPVEQVVASTSAKESSPVPNLGDFECLCVICKVLCKNIDEVTEHLEKHELVFRTSGSGLLCRLCPCRFPNCASAFENRQDLVIHFLDEHASKLKAVKLEDHLCAVFKDLDDLRDFAKTANERTRLANHTEDVGGFDGMRPEHAHLLFDATEFYVSCTGSQFSASKTRSDDTLHEGNLEHDTAPSLNDWSSNASTYD